MPGKRYSDYDMALLTANYAKLGPKACAAAIGRPLASVRVIACMRGLVSGFSRTWTEDEDRWLRARYRAIGGPRCAQHLRRTKDAVRKRARYIGAARRAS